MTNDIHDLELLLRSRIPLIIIETRDEKRVKQLFTKLAIKLSMPVMAWSATTGLQRVDFEAAPQKHASEPRQALGQIKATDTPSIYLMLDFHPYLDDPYNIRLLKEIAQDHHNLGHTLVLASHDLEVPPELENLAAEFSLSLPDTERLEAIVREEATHWTKAHPGNRVKTDRGTLDAMVRQLRGLTMTDARRIIRSVIFDDGAIKPDDLERITRARYQLIESNGALSCEFDTARFSEVGGLQNLKRWVELRRTAFLEPDADLDTPRGILLVGVQGGGKSLAAKAVAGLWGIPLLRLDFGTLYNKFFGETERNLREALKAAEAMAPCVLWIDEIEKAIASGDYDSGTSRRILGNLLTWMAERTAPVFIVATANIIEHLPPELIRKGRLDEIFFVDLPDAPTRAEIFAIHLRKRDQKPMDFDLVSLAKLTDGFTGAEIEQAIVAARYLARADGSTLNTDHVRQEIERTRPLSRIMTEKIARLRAWAAERTVLAN
ncbi:MAG: AAA family ATPase [Gammaproteobacteria bacterium]|nr:MAG: AAA family ATPase [Gammaproteobacteria bacterium]